MNKTLTTIFALAVASATTMSTAQEVKADAKAGATKISLCIGCHGIPGYQASFPEVYKVPKISGQGGKYIASALDAYRKGERRHPTMRGVADSLTDQDIADVAAYYEASGPAATAAGGASRQPTAQVADLLKRGACVSCHGDGFSKPIDPSYPKVAGQYPDYLFVALKSYKVGDGQRVGRTNGVMAGVAKQFSNAELKALADYVGSLDGHLETVAQPRFR